MADTSSSRQSYGATGSSAPAGGDRQRTRSKGPAGASSTSNKPEQPVTKVEPKVWLASEDNKSLHSLRVASLSDHLLPYLTYRRADVLQLDKSSPAPRQFCVSTLQRWRPNWEPHGNGLCYHQHTYGQWPSIRNIMPVANGLSCHF